MGQDAALAMHRCGIVSVHRYTMRTLGIARRLVGCFYCGLPCRGDVCGYCSDLPLRDPLVAKARQVLGEDELIVGLSEPERRVLTTGGQDGCALCEQARDALAKRISR